MRKKKARFRPLKSEIVLLDGGLNENVSSLELKPGELIRCKNYQHVQGSQGGYQSIAGYERYSGRKKPSTIAASSSDETEREAARSNITAVPGSGPIRGLHILEGILYAFRDDTGGSTGKMWRATNRGWQEVDTSGDPLSPGGTYRFFTHNFGTRLLASPSASPSEGTPSGTSESSPRDRKSTRLNSSHPTISRMPSSA